MKIFKHIGSRIWLASVGFVAIIGISAATLPAKKRIVFFGDSITEMGAWKGGYVDLIRQSVDSNNYAIKGAGIGGNKVYDLYLRHEADVLSFKPTTVVIYVGVNDVWHKKLAGTGTDHDKFIKFYQALIDKFKASGAEVIVCTPTVIGEKKNGENELDAELDKYSTAIRDLSVKNKLKLCDLRKIFMTYIAANNPGNTDRNVLTTDAVHLNEKGNRLVADSLLPLLK